MTAIEAAVFDAWQEWPDAKFTRYEWTASGDRMTRASFALYRRRGGNIIIHPVDSATGDAWVRATLADTQTMIASDGILHQGTGHPRVVSTPARVLGRYVRERTTLTLMYAVRRMTLMPARRLEAHGPAMRWKGRVQVGMDADLSIFDPVADLDEGSFRAPARPPTGIPHLLVAGVDVVRDGSPVEGRLPGQPVRGPIDWSKGAP